MLAGFRQGRYSALRLVTAMSGAAAIGPLVSGYLIEASGYLPALIFSGACSLVALGIYATLSMRARV